MHSPDYFVAVELPTNMGVFRESERRKIEAYADELRGRINETDIVNYFSLLEGTETAQEAASKILDYLVASEEGFVTLERK